MTQFKNIRNGRFKNSREVKYPATGKVTPPSTFEDDISTRKIYNLLRNYLRAKINKHNDDEIKLICISIRKMIEMYKHKYGVYPYVEGIIKRVEKEHKQLMAEHGVKLPPASYFFEGTEVKSGENKTDENTVDLYIQACDKSKKDTPTLDELANHTEYSKATWSRKLKDVIFLAELQKKLDEKINRSKTEKSRNKWIDRKLDISDKIERLNNDRLVNRSVSYNDEMDYNRFNE